MHLDDLDRRLAEHRRACPEAVTEEPRIVERATERDVSRAASERRFLGAGGSASDWRPRRASGLTPPLWVESAGSLRVF